MTRILCTGAPTPERLRQIMDAAVTRLGLTEVAVMAGDTCDQLVTDWCDRRWKLYRFYSQPHGVDVHLVFGGWGGAEWGRVIMC